MWRRMILEKIRFSIDRWPQLQVVVESSQVGFIYSLSGLSYETILPFLLFVNYTYFVIGWFNGGINYHIEHHLFPRMNHLHLPKIQPIVREFCAEKGIPYNYFPSVWGNFKSLVKHLHFLGHNDNYDNMALSPLIKND